MHMHLRIFATVIAAMCFVVIDCNATTLTWDSNGATLPNPSDGGGNWLATGRWWNGSGNQNWADANDAVFGTGTGTAGTYFVTNNSALVQPNSVTFTTPGSYTITIDSTDACQLSWTAPAGGIGSVSRGLWVGTNVSAQMDVPWRAANGSDIFLGSNTVLTFSKGTSGNNGTLIFKGSGAEASLINATNGLWGGITGSQLAGTMDLCGATLNILNSAIINAGTRFDIGRPATGAPGSDGIVNLSNGGQFNINVSSSTDSNANLQISRGGSGALNISAGGLVSTLSSGNSGRVLLIPDSSSQATMNISGGTLNVGTGAGGRPGISSLSLNLITLLGGSISYGSSASGIINVSGGIVSAKGIQIGSSSGTFTANPTNQINITGGTIYLDSSGISFPKNTGGNYRFSASGGTIAATADWSSACNTPMNLTNSNGDITFQAADTEGNSFDMSIASSLSGMGGFKKTGGGTLTLTGTNTYSGTTEIDDGTVVLDGSGSSVATGSIIIASNAMLALFDTASANPSNRINSSAPITMNGGTFEFINDGSAVSFYEAAGPLVINAGANVVSVFPASNGWTSTLTFFALTHNGGSVDFQMSSAGTSQNKVFFLSPPTLGVWITVNGGPAAYDWTNGLYAATGFTDISALGSTISNAPTSNVRINSVGSGGNIQLDSSETAINSLQQNTTTAATVATANETFRVNQIAINAGAQALIMGVSPGDGALTAGTAGGNLTLINESSVLPGIVINASVQDNTMPSSLTVLGDGMVTLAAPDNTYSGGTTISNGTLVVTTGTMAAMLYTNISGTLSVNVGAPGTMLPMNGFTFGGSDPQLAFNLSGEATNSPVPIINITGDVSLIGDVHVSITNPVPGTTVLLQYTARSGSGRFVAGIMPSGAGIVDDAADKTVSLVYLAGPTVTIPPLNTNEIVIASATPQQYGAVGDGVTDDSVAFQNALNALNNPNGAGGGVLYVPSAVYAFSNSITIPPGVTVQGNWADWSKSTNGVVGTLFEVYAGAGQSNGTPFITINSGALKGVSIWYPDQDPANITPYPFTIYLPEDDAVVQDVALINSYQGISAYNCAKHVISDVFGSPLYTGIQVDAEYDISHQENVRFSPDFWSDSYLPGAPAVGGPHANWMRTNGVAERLYRCDGEGCMDVGISGYNVGFYALVSVNGAPDASFYGGYISNCATAYLDASGGGNTGEEFTDFTLDGDIAVDRNTPNDASAYFHSCRIVGHSGISIHQTGGNSSTMQFQRCNVSGTVKVDGGIANFVDSSFSVAATSNHCVMGSGAIYAAFTGCQFTPARKITNSADSRRLVIDGRRSVSNALPMVEWADIQNDWLTRRPAKLDLFFATNAAGNGTNDDTAAIQAALNAAGANGGGIVYLPPGAYKLTDTLDVPSGVELRGSFPSRHPASLYDGHFKVTMLQPYGGAGTTNGPPAIALEANSGVLGLSISYELQNTNIIQFPPTIQGRGPDVYAYGVQCPNAYWYVDLNTYTCTNHFFYDVNGWALHYGFTVGNGSSGSIIHCMANSSYWGENSGSASVYVSAWQPAVLNYVEHNLSWFLLGDCNELMVKNFEIFSHTFMHCVSQNGRGPCVNGILTMSDGAVEDYRFESAANTVVNIVNPEWMVSSTDYPDLTGYGVISTPDFQGKARFFNAPLWGARLWDYVIQGGDVGFELTHSGYLSTNGSRVDGGVAHFVNSGWEGNTSSYYNIPFNSTSNGVPGEISEIIGCYAWTGVTNSLANANNPVNIWGNFGINNLVTRTPFDVTLPLLFCGSESQNIVLTWTNNMGAFNLCSSPSLSSPIWTVVTNVPYFETNCWTATDSIISTQRFYRLQQ